MSHCAVGMVGLFKLKPHPVSFNSLNIKVALNSLKLNYPVEKEYFVKQLIKDLTRKAFYFRAQWIIFVRL